MLNRGASMFRTPMVSVVVITRWGGNRIEKCLKSLRDQRYPSDRYEVIVVSDVVSSGQLDALCRKYDAKLIQLNGMPGAKRNLGVRESKGEIMSFCDDDVTVDRDWIKALVNGFIDQLVAVVGGPNLTPPDAGLRQRSSGYIFSSFVGTATMAARYISNGLSVRSADETDLISCNMAARKSIVDEVGGFPEDIWPNEENIFLHLVKKAGYKLLYVPNAVVWHDRRPVFARHLKQNFSYGRGRGEMTKRHPDSVKLVHFMPSLFVIFLILGLAASLLMDFLVKPLYTLILLTYSFVIVEESIRIVVKTHDYEAFPLLPVTFFLHHCSYGLGFMAGLIKGSSI